MRANQTMEWKVFNRIQSMNQPMKTAKGRDPKDKNVITSKWVYQKKGERYKASIPEVQHRTKKLGEKFPIHDLGPTKNCLGIRATRTENAIILDQEEYVNILLSRFNMAE